MLLAEIKQKKRELRYVGLVFHIRNICKNKGAVGMGIRHEGGNSLISIKTGNKIWEFNFDEYREGCRLLKGDESLADPLIRKMLHEKYKAGIEGWEKKIARLKKG
jgi:hypothetical protein